LVKGLTAASALRVVHSGSQRKLGLQVASRPVQAFIKSSWKYLFFWLDFNALQFVPIY
jgi:hypothetical protein